MKSRLLKWFTGRTRFPGLAMLAHATLIVSLALILFAASASAEPSVYVVTLNNLFGTVDLATGAFHPIGAPTTESLTNLVWWHGSLLSLTTSDPIPGYLVKINPATGETKVIGATGLGINAFALAEVRGKLYLTDFSNNIYSVDPSTGVASPIGPTGMPPDPTIPFTFNDDGTLNLCDESFYGVHGKLYATFDSFRVDPNSLEITPAVKPDLYQINPSSGVATLIGPTDLQVGASVQVDGKFYAFRLVITGFTEFGPQAYSQLVALDLRSGKTIFLRNIDAVAGPIFGAVPVRPRLWATSE
jgi:hypothetical protein